MKLKLTLFLAVVASVVTALTVAPLASSARPATATATLTGIVGPAGITGTQTGVGTVPTAAAGQQLTLGLTNLVFSVVNGTLQVTGNVTDMATGTVLGTFTTPITGAAASGTCQILDLTLGPLHLDLLGLVVDLNQVHLNITAQSGPGNLLGNLLCGVAHLLDGTSGLNGIANILNNLLGGL